VELPLLSALLCELSEAFDSAPDTLFSSADCWFSSQLATLSEDELEVESARFRAPFAALPGDGDLATVLLAGSTFFLTADEAGDLTDLAGAAGVEAFELMGMGLRAGAGLSPLRRLCSSVHIVCR
jgi:hypothetical protein